MNSGVGPEEYEVLERLDSIETKLDSIRFETNIGLLNAFLIFSLTSALALATLDEDPAVISSLIVIALALLVAILVFRARQLFEGKRR